MLLWMVNHLKRKNVYRQQSLQPEATTQGFLFSVVSQNKYHRTNITEQISQNKYHRTNVPEKKTENHHDASTFQWWATMFFTVVSSRVNSCWNHWIKWRSFHFFRTILWIFCYKSNPKSFRNSTGISSFEVTTFKSPQTANKRKLLYELPF